MGRMTNFIWQSLVDRARDQRLLPIVGDKVTGRLLFNNRELIQAWSDEIGYPVGSSLSMTRLAQYLSVEGNKQVAKEGYLAFLKRYLVKAARSDPGGQKALAALDGDIHAMRLAELAGRLNQAILDDEVRNPLRRLAQLPVKIYITTSYHNFLEQTLRSLGKAPRLEICYWDHSLKAPPVSPAGLNPLIKIREELIATFDLEELREIAFLLDVEFDDLAGTGPTAKSRELVKLLDRQERLPDLAQVAQRQRPNVDWASLIDPDNVTLDRKAPSVFEVDPNYVPSVEEPLVYHLLGLDAIPRSLVISEDDFLDFLVTISADKGIIPEQIKSALTISSLVLLGYDLQDWDFRILFRGLIARQRSEQRGVSVAIQLMPSDEAGEPDEADSAQDYLERYFDKEHFQVYWGSAGGFVQEFWRRWEKPL